MLNRPIVCALAALLLASLIAACGSQTAPDTRAQLPAHIRNAPERVVAAYDYAATHLEEVHKYPCYCGCNVMGHTSNLSCYVNAIHEDGSLSWDNHALGCSICVDITLDVKRLKGEGWSSPDVRRYIDATYSSAGPGTNTPFPQS